MTLQFGPCRQGTLVLTSTPFIHCVSEPLRLSLCNQCFKRQEALQRCSACTVLRYCSKNCQRQDWNTHKRECGYLKKYAPKTPTESVRLFLRLLIKHQVKETATLMEKSCGLTRCFSDLMTPKNLFADVEEIKRDENRMKQFMTICEGLKRHLRYELQELTSVDLLNLFGRMVVNSFSICDLEMQPIGVGVYLIPSKLDHSCEPNAVITFRGVELQLRTTQPLTTASEIKISYVDQLSTTKHRRRQLQEQYYFTCRCSRCEDTNMEQVMLSSACPTEPCTGHVLWNEEANSIQCDACGKEEFTSNYKNRRKNAFDTVNKSLQNIKELKRKNANDQILQCCANLIYHWKDILHDSNLYFIHLLDYAFDASVNLNKWEDALNYGCRTIQAYRMYYPKYHPALGIQLMKIGKLHLHLMNVIESLKYLQQAEDILQLTHGEDSELFRDLKELQYQCQDDL